jgi:hypothetical protein
MALSFTTQPSDELGAYSPILYQAYDSTNFAQTGFKYEFKVYVWKGAKASVPATPIVTIEKLADIYSGNRSQIFIHKIVAQYIEQEYQTYTSKTIGDGAVWARVTMRSVWDSGSTTAINSNTIYVTKGYALSLDGVNDPYPSRILTSRNVITLNQYSAIDLVWVDTEYVLSVTAGAFTHTFTAFSNSQNKFQAVDVVALLASASLTGQDTTLTFNKVGATTETKEVVYDCTNKFGQLDVLFLNPFGVYDTFHFNSLHRDSYAKEVESMYRGMYDQADVTAYYSKGLPIKTNFNQQVTTSRTASTGWINESDVESIMQIFYSRRVLFCSGSTLLASMVSDSAVQRKTNNVDKLIEYTLNFEISFPHLNTIVR